MDPKVCGKLLSLHRRGNGVDVEALRDRFPPPAGHRKRPQDGISRVAAVEKWFVASPDVFRV